MPHLAEVAEGWRDNSVDNVLHIAVWSCISYDRPLHSLFLKIMQENKCKKFTFKTDNISESTSANLSELLKTLSSNASRIMKANQY